MTVIWIEHDYHARASDEVELPEGVSFAQIKQWYVKWCCFHYTLDNVTWLEIDMCSDVEVNDTKRPHNVRIYGADATGSVDFDKVLAEKE